MRRYMAEFFGTFVLVFASCGSAVLAGDKIGYLGVSLAFGLSLLAMVYAIGPISGCHINPAVSVGLVVAKRFPASELPAYIVSQVVGGIAGEVDPRFFPFIAGTSPSSNALTASEVGTIITHAAQQANITRAAIRQPLGSNARVTIAVVDTSGIVLGIFRQQDAPVFGFHDVPALFREQGAHHSARGLVVFHQKRGAGVATSATIPL